jgi:lactate permease
MMTRFFGHNKKWREGLSIFPFALFAGLCFTVPYTLTGVFLGPEFPSLFGSLLGLLIVIPLAKSGFLIPKKTWDFPPQETWPAEWIGHTIEKGIPTRPRMSIFRAWLPYILVALLLLFSRLLSPLKNLLASVSFSWPDIFGTSISTGFQFLYLPGFLFIVAGLENHPGTSHCSRICSSHGEGVH